MLKDFEANIKSLLGNVSKVFIIKIVGAFLLFVLQIILTNRIGAKLYGQFTILNTIISIFILITVFGMDSSLIRYIPGMDIKDKLKFNLLKTLAYIVVCITLIVSILMILFKVQIMQFFKIDNPIYYYMLPVALIIMSLEQLIDGYLQGEKKTDKVAFFGTFLNPIIKITLFLSLSYCIKNLLMAAVISLIGTETIMLSIRFLYINIEIRKTVFSIESKFSKEQYNSFFRYSLSLFAILGIGSLVTNINTIIINVYAGFAQVGIFSVSQSLMALVGIFASPFIVFWPVMSEFYKKNDTETLQKMFKIVVKLISLLAMPAIVFMIIFSNDLLHLFGKTFSGGATILCVLLIGTACNTLTGPVGALLNMTNYAKHNFIANIILAIFNVSLNLLLVPKYGAIGAAIATSASIVLINFTNIIQNKLLLNIFPYDKENLIMLIMGIILYFVDYKLYGLITINILLKMLIIGALDYALFASSYYIILKPDLKSFMNLIKK